MTKKKHMIIATHGHLAHGFESAMKIIVGDSIKLNIISCYLEPDFNLLSEIEKVMATIDFEKTSVVVCTDLLGGSVNNEFLKVMHRYPFHLITNINLGFLIDMALTEEPISSEMIEHKIVDSTFSLKYVNNYIFQSDEIDDL